MYDDTFSLNLICKQLDLPRNLWDNYEWLKSYFEPRVTLIEQFAYNLADKLSKNRQ